MFLLDTVVLSELHKARRQRNGNLVHWMGGVTSQDLYLSVLTIGEIESGIERQRQVNPPFAESIASWLDIILRTYEGRILAIDRRVSAATHGSDVVGVEDVLIERDQVGQVTGLDAAGAIAALVRRR